MYGLFHVVIRDLIINKYGLEQMDAILEKTGLRRNEDFMMYDVYDDSISMKLFEGIATHLELTVEDVFLMFGEGFFDYCVSHGFDKMLRTLGESVVDFLQNLDSLHALLSISYKGVRTPSFRCEQLKDGSLYLYYHSPRRGLYPMVVGLLTSVCKELFNVEIEMIIEKRTTATNPCDHVQDIVKFHVKGADAHDQSCARRTSLKKRRNSLWDFTPYIPQNTALGMKDIIRCFPYHMIVNKDLKVVQSGLELQKFCTRLRQKDAPLRETFHLRHPTIDVTFDKIVEFINEVYVFRIVESEDEQGCENYWREEETTPDDCAASPQQYDDKASLEKGIVVSGQMLALDEAHVMYVCSLQMSSLDELQEHSVFLSDIPMYDRTRELILMNQQRIAELDVNRKLDEATNAWRTTSRALEVEKKKTVTLLHELLPAKVARQLLAGEPVNAEKYDDVTVLFSDIVQFTSMCAVCSPIEIIEMLNTLYSRFDKLTEEIDVYKLGTIGDAYIVIAGVPERTHNHAEKIGVFALGMIDACSRVASPATRTSIKMRVGIHDGPVVAGVVGNRQPKYCVFGDTMNTASRMESTGVPDLIHISHPVHRKLKRQGFTTVKRGEMEVKGKGTMTTYFLIGLFEGKDKYQNIRVSKNWRTYQKWMEHRKSSTENSAGGMFASIRNTMVQMARGARQSIHKIF